MSDWHSLIVLIVNLKCTSYLKFSFCSCQSRVADSLILQIDAIYSEVLVTFQSDFCRGFDASRDLTIRQITAQRSWVINRNVHTCAHFCYKFSFSIFTRDPKLARARSDSDEVSRPFMVSQITGNSYVPLTACSGWNQINDHRFVLLALGEGSRRWPLDSFTKGQ